MENKHNNKDDEYERTTLIWLVVAVLVVVGALITYVLIKSNNG